jgi:EpsD family peptidyl-prolyl cis-trans isomerase
MKSLNSTVLIAALLLAGCGSANSDSVPSGQVVATVDGQEVTVADLNAEIGDGNATDPAAQAEALERILARKLLAAEARRQDLDSTPLAAILKAQAEDTALAQALARKVTDGVPKVSEDEVTEFLRSFPASISQRRLLSVEQLFVPVMPPKTFEELKKVTRLEDAEAVLNADKVMFRRTVTMVDTLTLNPDFAAKIVSSEGSDIFIIPNGQTAEIGKIVSSRIEPITGDQARVAARTVLMRQRSVEMVNNALGKVIADGRRKVQVNPQYQGKAPPVAPIDATKQAAPVAAK